MNTITAPEIFLQNLRTATSQSHADLESLPLSSRVSSPEVTKEDYMRYLAVMHDIMKDAETHVYPALTAVVRDLEERKKTVLLERDLKFLGYAKTSGKKTFDFNPDNFSEAFAFGVLYVLEGSTLGGRILLKNINDALGYDENSGASFFYGYGTKTGFYWKNFLNEMTAYVIQNECENEFIAGANFAFTAIKEHFIKSA